MPILLSSDIFRIAQFVAPFHIRRQNLRASHILPLLNVSGPIFIIEFNLSRIPALMEIHPLLAMWVGILIAILGSTPVGSTIVAVDIAAYLICWGAAKIMRTGRKTS